MEFNQTIHLRDSLVAFRNGDFAAAESAVQKMLAEHWTNGEAKNLLKCAVFWKERTERLSQLFDDSSKADYLLREFIAFQRRFLIRIGPVPEELLEALGQWIFNACLSFYRSVSVQGGMQTAELHFKSGRCLKGLGDYEGALREFEKALSLLKDDAGILAEMADCFDMMSESRVAKVLFREAFFHNPERVEIDFLQSPMIHKIIEELKEKGKTLEQIREWLPVYGVIHGIFSVKRELRPLELGQLKQSIYSLKNELGVGADVNSVVLPRLINKYFWLIDHFLAAKEDRSKVEEALLNIRVIAPDIYEEYIK